jgi:hypothetical protein
VKLFPRLHLQFFYTSPFKSTSDFVDDVICSPGENKTCDEGIQYGRIFGEYEQRKNKDGRHDSAEYRGQDEFEVKVECEVGDSCSCDLRLVLT